MKTPQPNLLAPDENITIVENTESPVLSGAKQVSAACILKLTSGSLGIRRGTDHAYPLLAAAGNARSFVADTANALGLLTLAEDAEPLFAAAGNPRPFVADAPNTLGLLTLADNARHIRGC